MEEGKNLSKAQAKARSFIEEHKVEKILGEMLNSLVHARDPQPIIFMVRAHFTLLANKQCLWHLDQILVQLGD